MFYKILKYRGNLHVITKMLFYNIYKVKYCSESTDMGEPQLAADLGISR